jgi:hypothetical protein
MIAEKSRLKRRLQAGLPAPRLAPAGEHVKHRSLTVAARIGGGSDWWRLGLVGLQLGEAVKNFPHSF